MHMHMRRALIDLLPAETGPQPEVDCGTFSQDVSPPHSSERVIKLRSAAWRPGAAAAKQASLRAQHCRQLAEAQLAMKTTQVAASGILSESSAANAAETPQLLLRQRLLLSHQVEVSRRVRMRMCARFLVATHSLAAHAKSTLGTAGLDHHTRVTDLTS